MVDLQANRSLNFYDLLDGDRRELESITLVELAHELDPMETQRVQEALHDVHDHEHTESGTNEDKEAHEHHQDAVGLEAWDEGAIVEHFGQLRVSQ